MILFFPLSSYLSFPFYFSFFRSLWWGSKGRMRLGKPEMDPLGRRCPLFLAPPRHSRLRGSLMPPAPEAAAEDAREGQATGLGSSRRFSVTVLLNFSLAGLGEGFFVPLARWRRGGGVPSPRSTRPRPNFIEEPAQRRSSWHAGKDRGCQRCPWLSALRNLLHSQPENDRARFQAGIPSPKGF